MCWTSGVIASSDSGRGARNAAEPPRGTLTSRACSSALPCAPCAAATHAVNRSSAMPMPAGEAELVEQLEQRDRRTSWPRVFCRDLAVHREVRAAGADAAAGIDDRSSREQRIGDRAHGLALGAASAADDRSVGETGRAPRSPSCRAGRRAPTPPASTPGRPARAAARRPIAAAARLARRADHGHSGAPRSDGIEPASRTGARTGGRGCRRFACSEFYSTGLMFSVSPSRISLSIRKLST